MTDPTGRPPTAIGAPAVAVRNLRKTYGGDDGVVAVEDASFTVDRGEVVGLLGPNGAGKTTTLKAALGLLVPTAGSCEVMGVDVHEETARVYRQVGAMLEGARNVYWRLTPRENLSFFASLQGIDPRMRREDHDRLLDSLGLLDRADDAVNDFSRGMKGKVALAATLARETPVVFLDEPTLGLDVEATRDLRSRIRRLADEEGRTVLLSSHDMDTVQAVCDRAVVMNEGRVVADDAVENLVGLFRTRDYEVTVAGTLGGRRATLEREFGADGFRETADGLRFTATVPEGQFYDLVDHLRDADVEVVSVSARETDLEEAFLRLTGRDHGDGPDHEGRPEVRAE
ncbi:ABC transporter ATP-binding protein [Haloglomus litoreum]|uniref:ABC transporter ATP-binding protein n=1 Tax=Haloglomus litoreum TaxID=3034026 RepID=UPI0023E815ED|nr:ABC transporter ATP-binding protein [Haloglomus sp. DT116]